MLSLKSAYVTKVIRLLSWIELKMALAMEIGQSKYHLFYLIYVTDVQTVGQ